MTSFAGQIAAFAVKTERRAHEAFDAIVDATKDSIVEGSTVTGAPGQPVGIDGSPRDGALRDSWTIERSENSARIASSAPYALDVELNLAGAQFHNHGPHSVAATVTEFGRLAIATVESLDA